MAELERRAALDLRAEPEGRILTGVALKYSDTATIRSGLRERFEPGAFGSLGDVRLNVQHDRGRLIARTGAGLTLTDSAELLAFRAELPDTRESADVLELVRAKILKGASIEFRALLDSVQAGVRVVRKAALSAISIVDDPAYSLSIVEARWRQEPTRRAVKWWAL